MLDQPPIAGEEPNPGRIPGQIPDIDVQCQTCPVRTQQGSGLKRLRQIRARPGKDRRDRRIFRSRPSTCIQTQRENPAFRNTVLLTDQPTHLGCQIQRSSGLPACRDGEIHQVDRSARVAIVGQRTDPDQLGMRPANWPHGDAFRQTPADARRLPGIARILPVGVPSGPDVEDEGELYAISRGDLLTLGKEPGSDVFGYDLTRADRCQPQQQQDQEDASQQAFGFASRNQFLTRSPCHLEPAPPYSESENQNG